jgi:hypothetical protein
MTFRFETRIPSIAIMLTRLNSPNTIWTPYKSDDLTPRRDLCCHTPLNLKLIDWNSSLFISKDIDIRNRNVSKAAGQL